MYTVGVDYQEVHYKRSAIGTQRKRTKNDGGVKDCLEVA